MKTEHTSCGYTAPFFGASYVDGICSDGYMWDLDSCDEPGGPLFNGGDIPCPSCNHEAFIDYHLDSFSDDGSFAAEAGKARVYEHKAVRCEQPQDRARMEKAWLKGYDEYLTEKGAADE